jgi:hypothetical protein
MTPKEKAIDLIDRYYSLFSLELENTIDITEAQECALIVVDEIMKAVGWEKMELGVDRDNYWEEVKQEIKKL